MPEKINELNIQNTKETIPGDEKQSREGPEITEGEELNEVTTDISEIKDKIDHDKPITEKNILELKKSINDLTIDIGGERVPIKEIKNRKDLKRHIEIFKEIEAENFEHNYELTFITSNTAKSLSKRKDCLYLDGLITLSDNVAESLSKHEGGYLSLDGLTFLSDNATESLSEHKGWLYLKGLTSLSDNAAESLSKHGGKLYLDGLTSLSDNAAKSLSKHKEYLSVRYYINQQINKFKK